MVGDHSVAVSFDAVFGSSYYNLTVKSLGDETVEDRVHTTNETSYLVTDLLSGFSYTLEIISVKVFREGEEFASDVTTSAFVTS